MQVLNKFSPLTPGGNSRNNAATIKSVMELIRMKERYAALDAMNSDPQLALAQLLLGKVAEESCLWVSTTISNCISVSVSLKYLIHIQLNESPDINIPDCTNIDLSLLNEIYQRIDLYERLENTFDKVREFLPANPHQIHTCAWMNHRVLDDCAVQNTNYGHRDTLNKLCDPALNNIRPRRCDPQLCTRMS